MADGGTGGRAHPARLVDRGGWTPLAIAIKHGLSRQPARPRRWAIGAYYTDVDGTTSLGEMHIRRGHYIGVAPVPGGLTNACLVDFARSPRPAIAQAAPNRSHHFSPRTPSWRRASRARDAASPAVMLGPMAVDTVRRRGAGAAVGGRRRWIHRSDDGGWIAVRATRGRVGRFGRAGRVERQGISRARAPGARRSAPSRISVEVALQSSAAVAGRIAHGVSAAAMTAKVWPAVFTKMIQFAGDCGAAPNDRQAH